MNLAWFHLSLINGMLIIMLLLFVWMVIRFNRSEVKYNVVDILMGPDDRANLTNHILLTMAGLAAWVVIDREMDGKEDVGSILVQVLGIFVLGKAAVAVTGIIKRPDAPSQTATETTVKRVETVTAGPPGDKADVRPAPMG
jgi:hypothetical protein